MNKLGLSILFLCLLVSLSRAQLQNGCKTLLHTQTAKSLESGQLNIYSNMNFYTKAGEFIGETKPQDFSSVNYWLVAGNAVFSYGIIKHFDASLGIRIYQDTHKENDFNLPGDLFLTLRAGSFAFEKNHFHNAFLASFRIPTGEEHNYPFAEYASGAFEYGFMYAISFYKDQYLPNRAFNAHFNIGFWNHNENGQIFKFSNGQEFESTVNSTDLRMALAAVFPSSMFDFRLELHGALYLSEPNDFIYSAEEYTFLTPSIRYKPSKWASLDLGVDFRISPEREMTTANIPIPGKNLNLPGNYPGWKIHLGANIAFNIKKKRMGTSIDYEREEAKEKIELFETIIEEREKAADVQDEVENLRDVRKEAEKEIEKLKKVLED